MPGQKREARLRSECAGHPRFSDVMRSLMVLDPSPREAVGREDRSVAEVRVRGVFLGPPPRRSLHSRRPSPQGGGISKREASPPKPARQHLFENLAADGLVGQRAVTPPPAVALHLFGGRDKALLHLGKIGI